MANFLDRIRDLYTDEQAFLSDLRLFLEREKKPIHCRHSDCYSIGTVDKTKNVSMIRKSTVEAFFRNQINSTTLEITPTSTKCRVHLLVERLTGANNDNTDGVIRHLCGCGSCCNPQHLKAGSQAENINDTHIHFVYEKLYNMGRMDLIKELRSVLDPDIF
jgi:hypothetical protein